MRLGGIPVARYRLTGSYRFSFPLDFFPSRQAIPLKRGSVRLTLTVVSVEPLTSPDTAKAKQAARFTQTAYLTATGFLSVLPPACLVVAVRLPPRSVGTPL